MTSAWNKAQGVFRSVAKFKQYRPYQLDNMQTDTQFDRKIINKSDEICNNPATNTKYENKIISKEKGKQEAKAEGECEDLETKIKRIEDNQVNNTKTSIYYVNEFKKEEKLCKTNQPIMVAIGAEVRHLPKTLLKKQEDENEIVRGTYDNLHLKNLTDREENGKNYNNDLEHYQYNNSNDNDENNKDNENDSKNDKTKKIDSFAKISAGNHTISKHELENNEEFCHMKHLLENNLTKSIKKYFTDVIGSQKNNLEDTNTLMEKCNVENRNSKLIQTRADDKTESINESECAEDELYNKLKGLRKNSENICLTDCIGLKMELDQIKENLSDNLNICDHFKSILQHKNSNLKRFTSIKETENLSVPEHENIGEKGKVKFVKNRNEYKIKPADDTTSDDKLSPLFHIPAINLNENQQTYKESRKYFSTTKIKTIEMPVYRGISKSNLKSAFKSILENDKNELLCESNILESSPNSDDKVKLIEHKLNEDTFHIEREITPDLETTIEITENIIQSENEHSEEKRITKSLQLCPDVKSSNLCKNSNNSENEVSYHVKKNEFNNNLSPSKTPRSHLQKENLHNENYTIIILDDADKKNNEPRLLTESDENLETKIMYEKETEFIKKLNSKKATIKSHATKNMLSREPIYQKNTPNFYSDEKETYSSNVHSSINYDILYEKEKEFGSEFGANNEIFTSSYQPKQLLMEKKPLENKRKTPEKLEEKVAYVLKTKNKKNLPRKPANKHAQYANSIPNYERKVITFDKPVKNESRKFKVALSKIKSIPKDYISIVPSQYTNSPYENHTKYYNSPLGLEELQEYMRKQELKKYLDEKNFCLSKKKKNNTKFSITKSARNESITHASKQFGSDDPETQISENISINSSVPNVDRTLATKNYNETNRLSGIIPATQYVSKSIPDNRYENNLPEKIDFVTKYHITPTKESNIDKGLSTKMSAYMSQMKHRVISGTQLDEGTYKKVRRRNKTAEIIKKKKLRQDEETALFFLIPKSKSKMDNIRGIKQYNIYDISKNTTYLPKAYKAAIGPNEYNYLAEYVDQNFIENGISDTISKAAGELYIGKKILETSNEKKLGYDQIENYDQKNAKKQIWNSPNYKYSLSKNDTVIFQDEKLRNNSRKIINTFNINKERKKLPNNMSFEYNKNTTKLSEKYKLQESKKPNEMNLRPNNSKVERKKSNRIDNKKTSNNGLLIAGIKLLPYDNKTINHSDRFNHEERLDDVDVNYSSMSSFNNKYYNQDSAEELSEHFRCDQEKETRNEMANNVIRNEKFNSNKVTKKTEIEIRNEKNSWDKTKIQPDNIAKHANDIAETLDIIKNDIINTIQSVGQGKSNFETLDATDAVTNAFSETMNNLNEEANNLSNNCKQKIVDKNLKPIWNKPPETSYTSKYNKKISNEHFISKTVGANVSEPLQIQYAPQKNLTEQIDILSKVYDVGTGRRNTSKNNYYNIKVHNVKEKNIVAKNTGTKSQVSNKKIKKQLKEKLGSNRNSKYKLRKSFYELAASMPDYDEQEPEDDMFLVKQSLSHSRKLVKNNPSLNYRNFSFTESKHKRNNPIKKVIHKNTIRSTSSKSQANYQQKNVMNLKYTRPVGNSNSMLKYRKVYRKTHSITNSKPVVYNRQAKEILEPMTKRNYLSVHDKNGYNYDGRSANSQKDSMIFPDKIELNKSARGTVKKIVNDLNRANDKNNTNYNFQQSTNSYYNQSFHKMKTKKTATAKINNGNLLREERQDHNNFYKSLAKINNSTGKNYFNRQKTALNKCTTHSTNSSMNNRPNITEWDPSSTDDIDNKSPEMVKRSDDDDFCKYDVVNMMSTRKLPK